MRSPGSSRPRRNASRKLHGLLRQVLAAALLGAWATLSYANADEPVPVSEGEAWQHLDTRADPEWPEDILESNHTSGTLAYTLVVAPDGRVIDVSPWASGLPAVDPTIEAALLRWTFHPFERDGHKVAATFHLTYLNAFGAVPAPGDDSNVAERFSEAQTFACDMRLRIATNWALQGQAKEICRQSVAAVERLPAGTHLDERCKTYRGMVAALGAADTSADAERDRALADQVCGEAERARLERQAANAHDPIVGAWHWVADQTLIIRLDGTFLVMQDSSQINSGRWKQLQPARYQFRHDFGGYIDTVTLSPDTVSLAGANNFGQPVAGHRSLSP